MKIQSLRVEQFKKFDHPVLVDDFGDGLNLVAGPNETGKSTLLLALRAVLFERHGTKSDAVRGFSPHDVTGARPTVTLEFEIDGEAIRLEKSFLRRPSAFLETSSGHRFEGADAETELKRLLGLDPSEKTPVNKGSPAHFGVLLTPQTGSFEQPNLSDGTRHRLEAAIAADIAELGNQSEVDGLLAEFDDMLFDVVSKRGEPKNRYREVSTRLNEIEGEIVAATGERDALRDQLDRLEQALAERDRLQTADSSENLAERLASLEAARAAAVHRQQLDNQHLAARQRLQAVQAKRAARQTRLEERQRIEGEIEATGKAAEDAKSRLGLIEEALSERAGKLADLGETLQAASRRRRDLEALGRGSERLRQIEATLSALATDVRLDLEESALDRITLNGEPTPAARDLRQVTEGLTIEIEDIGQIGIEPKIEPMREALAAKTEVENEIGGLLRTLDIDPIEQEAVEAAWQETASAVGRLERSRGELETALGEDRQQEAVARAALDAATERRDRQTRQLAEIEATDDAEDLDTLDAEIAEAGVALNAADKALQAVPQIRNPGTPSLDEEITALRARIEERRRAIDEANRTVLALESAIAVRAGLGLDEKIDQLERQHHLLAEERDAFALDHQALSLLQSTLRAAADEAKATFNAPLSARLAPYIQGLFPETTPLVTPDFSIRALDRNGVEEPFHRLSDGTREQIAILARLAYADMLQDEGLPAIVVLDDALAFSDSARLESMFAMLEQAAKRMQIIILTCHEDRFTELKATRLHIAPAPDQATSAA